MAEIVLPFPVGGVVRVGGAESQAEQTCYNALNVRPIDSIAGRMRGGGRPGIEKVFQRTTGSEIWMLNTCRFLEDEHNKSKLIWSSGGQIFMETDNGDDYELIISAATLSRFNPICSVERAGKLYIANSGRSPSGNWVTIGNTAAGGGHVTTALRTSGTWSRHVALDYNSTSVARSSSAEVAARLSYDGVPLIFDPAARTLTNLTASAGTVPTGCSICVLYRDRLVLAGDYANPQQWYMSQSGDPTNWDYALQTATAPVSGTTSKAGMIADPVTALAPHSDLCMIMASRTTLWILRGDPVKGSLDNISFDIGIISQNAWCHTADGWMCFLSADGVYVMPNQCSQSLPERLSRLKIPEELIDVDPTMYAVSMAYDIRDVGVHLWLTSLVEGLESQHWWIDWQNKSFWPVEVPLEKQPTAICQRRDRPDLASSVTLGCADGYIRRHNRAALDDDGDDITSYVYFTPMAMTGTDEMILHSISAKLAEGTADIAWSLHTGGTVEEALASSSRRSGIWSTNGGTELNKRPTRFKIQGAAIVLKLAPVVVNTKWSIEQVTVDVEKIACGSGGCK